MNVEDECDVILVQWTIQVTWRAVVAPRLEREQAADPHKPCFELCENCHPEHLKTKVRE